jgi:hypothetical protein
MGYLNGFEISPSISYDVEALNFSVFFLKNFLKNLTLMINMKIPLNINTNSVIQYCKLSLLINRGIIKNFIKYLFYT